MEQPRKVIFDESNEPEIVEKDAKWEEFNLKPLLVRGIYAVGFERPSFIQKKSVPIIAKGNNIRAQAQSGTGKTGAFCVGALERVDENINESQVLILVSTREIARQIANTCEGLGKYMDIKTILLTGGCPRSEDIKLLKERTNHIIVGTPGRIFDLLEDGAIKCQFIKMLILDEADELCKGEFLTQVHQIYEFLNPENLQVLFFSATYSEEELKTISYIVNDPIEIDLRNEEYTLQGIKQYFVNIGSQFGGKFTIEKKKQELIYKVQVLISILREQSLCQIMIFIRRKNDAQEIYDLLKKDDFSCALISSELDQESRVNVLNEFRTGQKRILVTSDLCKRGIDVQGLSVVICLDVPPYEAKEDFIHRIGRSGRYGRKGIALHILNEMELQTILKIADDFRTTIEPLPKTFKFKE